MKRWMVSVFLLLPIWAFPQYYFYDETYLDPEFLVEIGFGVGMMGCKTDLGNKEFIPSIKGMHSCLTLLARVQWQGGFCLKASYTNGRVSAADSLIRGNGPGDIARRKRNLHFFSIVQEWALNIQYFPRSAAGQPGGCQPFISLGTGYYRFRPKGDLMGQSIDLVRLRTEGSKDKPYKLQQFNLIGGIGLRYEWNARISTSLTLEHCFLFTDHLDDVSERFIDPIKRESPMEEQDERWLKEWYKLSDPLMSKPGAIRGNPKKNDSYSTMILTVGVALNRKRLDKN